jgi:hypothetical protein
MDRRLVPLFVAAVFATPATARAQIPRVSLELRAGAAAPIGSFATGSRAGEGAGAGPALALGFTMSGVGRRSVHIGFHQTRFGCEDAGCTTGRSFVATGMDAGLRFGLRENESVIPWMGVGVLTARLDARGLSGSRQGVSRLGYGGELSLGVYLFRSDTSPMGLNPTLRAGAVNTNLPDGHLLRVRYLAADFGIALGF